MVEFNGIGEGGLNDVLLRRLSVAGGAPSPTVEPALFPSLVLENDRIEWGFLKGELTYVDQNAVAAGGAGTRSSAQLINTNPSSLVVVRTVQATVTGSTLLAKLYFIGLSVTPFGSIGTSSGICIDTRSNRGGSCKAVYDNTLGVVAGTSRARFLVNSTLPCPFVLAPGWALYVSPSADNIAIDGVNFVWTERQAEPRELV